MWLFALIVSAQNVPASWDKTLPGTVQWQKTTALGHYIVATNNTLFSIDPETSNIIWSKKLTEPVLENQVAQVGNSPLLSINLGTSVSMFDPFTGETLFDSEKAGIREIRDQIVLYRSNGILVSGRTPDNKDILVISSLTNGEIVWKLEDDFGRLVTASDLSPSEILVVTIYNNYRINTQTGELIWKNDVSEANKQLGSMGAFGDLMKQAASNMAQNIDFNVQFYKDPFRPVFYIASEQEGKAQTTGFSTTTSSGETPFHTTYTAFSLVDGNRLWENELDINGKIGTLYFDERGLVVLPDDGQNTNINLYDYKTKEGKWGKKGRGIKIKGGIYDYSQSEGGLLLVSKNLNNKNFITYLDLESGTLTFDKPVKINGDVIFSEMTPKGLLLITTQEVNILNKSSGELLLDGQISTSPSLTAQDENTLYAFDVRNNVIKALDKKSASVTALGGEIVFEGKESPSYISIRERGLFINSAQNLALLNYSGEKIFQTYLEAPREPGILRALRYAQAVRAAYIGAVSYAGAAAYQAAGQEISKEDEVTGSIATGIGQAYGELGDAATDFAKQSWQMANARFKATQEADDYIVILSQIDKTYYLIKVNKDTGETEGQIALGKDREPSYAMDGATGAVFYQTGPSEITTYKF